MTHGITCKCNDCHRLRSKALSEPGRYGRIRGGYCTDCRGPADPVRSTAHYHTCKKCRFERFERIDFNTFAIDAPRPRPPPVDERHTREPERLSVILREVLEVQHVATSHISPG